MLKIFVRIHTVDMNAWTGRDHHPTREMQGRYVRVTNLDTVPDQDDDQDLSYQVFHGIVVDEGGHDVDGGEVELLDHEIESYEGVPVLFGEMRA